MTITGTPEVTEAMSPDGAARADRLRVGVLGAGGLGRAAARIIGMKRELSLCAMCDSRGVLYSPAGLDARVLAERSGDLVDSYQGVGPVDDTLVAWHGDDALGKFLDAADDLDGLLVMLPNLPNAFIPSVVERFVQRRRGLVLVDVLKRTSAVRQMFALDETVKASAGVVLTGCGATPGFLAAAAVLAAQSFIEVDRVKIWWGVGIASWDGYRATIREDLAHLPGVAVERAQSMTDADVEALLERTSGLLELRRMEHADDLLLQRVGVVDRLEQVEVGGVMDTRSPKKPVSTTMTLTGTTFEGKRSSHTFTLGDETTMAANVIGPALGYLKRGVWLKQRGIFGVFGSTEFLPLVVR